MKTQKTYPNKPIALDLGNSETLRNLGWTKPTFFSWCVDYEKPETPRLSLTENSMKEDIIAPAPTSSELLDALPPIYNELYIRINMWEKNNKRGYSISYCREDGSAEFLTEDSTLEGALASMWQWMHGEDLP